MSSSPPVGSELTIQQIFGALRWKSQQFALLGADETSDGDESIVAGKPRSTEEYISLIRHANRCISTMASQRNTAHVAMNRLPVEILTRIFKLLQDPTPVVESEANIYAYKRDPFLETAFSVDIDHHLAPNSQWVKPLTAVCHLWRQIALSYPNFWCSINLGQARDPGNSGQLFLCRSAPVLARVWGPYISPNDLRSWNEFIAAIKTNIVRIEELHFANSYVAPLDLFQTSMPNLRSLTPSFESSIFPSVIAPRLQRLRFRSFALTFPHQLLHQLTHLSLTTFGGAWSIEMLLDLLRPGIHMEELILKFDAPVSLESPENYRNLAPVTMNHLRLLELIMWGLDYTPEPSALFVQKLAVPRTAEIRWYVKIQSRVSQVGLQPISFPRLGQIRTLLCGFPFTPGIGNASLLPCRYLETLLFLPQVDEFFQLFANNLTGVRILVLVGRLNLPDDFVCSSSIEELHVPRRLFWEVLDLIDREEDPMFPNITTLTLWKAPTDTLAPVEAPWGFLHRDASQVGPEETQKLLLERGEALRKRPDGTSYLVRLRDIEPELNIFTFEGMSNRIGTGL